MDPTVCRAVLLKLPQLHWAAGSRDLASPENPSIPCYHHGADLSTWTRVFPHGKKTAHTKFLRSCSTNKPGHTIYEHRAFFWPPPTPVLIPWATPVRESKKREPLKKIQWGPSGKIASLPTVSAGSYFNMKLLLSWKGNIVWGRKPAFSHCLGVQDVRTHASV